MESEWRKIKSFELWFTAAVLAPAVVVALVGNAPTSPCVELESGSHCRSSGARAVSKISLRRSHFLVLSLTYTVLLFARFWDFGTESSK